jgi:murein DD-endopeptidase MepM/ murein hydrolase activator NlpD
MTRLRSLFIVAAFLVFIVGQGLIVWADSATDLQNQIDISNNQIAQLKDEIAKLQNDLNAISKQKQTLQTAVTQLNLNIQKLQKSITLTQAQITQKDREIYSLSGSIATTTGAITTTQGQVADSLRQLEAVDSQPLVVTFLGGGTLSDFFDQAAGLTTLRTELQNKIVNLSSLKSNLETNKNTAEGKRRELAALNRNLSEQKQGLAIARDSQNKLLQETKNQESNYQAQIAQKKALESKFEQDLLSYESQLNLIVNPGSFAQPGAGILSWPLDQPYITQYFGNTDFSTANPQIYSGRGHNAIDLRATPGTPIRASRDGEVRGTGNTDLTCPGASYGKWIFIDHDDGLSTLYAHLSTILVSTGQSVERGQVIAYSDTTGYATGPHLHFGVYASSGSKIASFPSKSCAGKIYTMPVADVSAYLNPLSYLPGL